MNLIFLARRPITITVIFIAVSLLGIFAFSNLGVDLLPNVNLPHLRVVLKTSIPFANFGFSLRSQR
ncbi:MAG: hypothetical protein AB1394_09330 [Bacteroidota bacterium]